MVADLENKEEYPSLLEQSPENSPQTKPKRQYYNQAAFYDEEDENDDDGWERFDMESDTIQGYSKRNNSNDSTHVMVDEEEADSGPSTLAVGPTRGNRNNNKKNSEYNIVVMKEKEKKDNNSKELNFTDEEDEEPLMKTKEYAAEKTKAKENKESSDKQ